jgi:hypothetical protein
MWLQMYVDSKLFFCGFSASLEKEMYCGFLDPLVWCGVVL